MKQRILYLFTRTPLHVGAGASVGAIDQPVQRERHTGFPIVPGSSLKGVLRDHLGKLGIDAINKYFGQGGDDKVFTAGEVSFGEARLLLFPVRSARGAFALATSPLALQRFARDAKIKVPIPELAGKMTCLAGEKVVIQDKGVVLEEFRFNFAGAFPIDWENLLTGLLGDAVLAGAKGRFVLLADEDLSHFAKNACQVNQHVRIDDDTGTADSEGGGLFNEETVPSETLFYAALTNLRGSQESNPVLQALELEQLVQFGAGGSTGLGFCTVKLAGGQ